MILIIKIFDGQTPKHSKKLSSKRCYKYLIYLGWFYHFWKHPKHPTFSYISTPCKRQATYMGCRWSEVQILSSRPFFLCLSTHYKNFKNHKIHCRQNSSICRQNGYYVLLPAVVTVDVPLSSKLPVDPEFNKSQLVTRFAVLGASFISTPYLCCAAPPPCLTNTSTLLLSELL